MTVDKNTYNQHAPYNKTSHTVLVGGCFDILHYGHISFLKQAKSLGSHLIVALESDINTTRMKGIHRPIHTQKQRKEMLRSLACVDEIILLKGPTQDKHYKNLVTRVSPDIIAITQGDPMREKKEKLARSVGAQLVVIKKIKTPSTSQLAKLIGLE